MNTQIEFLVSTWNITLRHPHDLYFIIPPPPSEVVRWVSLLLAHHCWRMSSPPLDDDSFSVWLRRIWATGWFAVQFQILRKWIRWCLLFILCRELREGVQINRRSRKKRRPNRQFRKRVSKSPVGIVNFKHRGSPAIWRMSSLLRIGSGNFTTGSKCRFRRSKNSQIFSSTVSTLNLQDR